jgi:hypothetical protein
VPVELTLQPLPEKLLRRNFETVQMTLFAGTVEIGKNRWSTPNLASQTITFDARTGLPRAIEVTTARGEQRFDLSELPADERRVFLPVGTVVYHFNMHQRTHDSRPVPVFYWPESRQEEDCLRHVVNADEKSWALQLPQEYLSTPLSEAFGIEEESNTTLKLLQGKWHSGEGASSMIFEIAGSRCRSSEQGKAPGEWLPFTLDVSHDPCWIDIDAMQGVFELNGDGLILCIGVKRPAGLVPVPNEQVERYVLKRDAPVSKPAPTLKNDATDGNSRPE